MTLFFAILAGVALCALWAYYTKTRKMVRDLEEAVRTERRLLLDESSKRLKRLGFNGLVSQVNGLMDRYNEHAQEESGYSNQIEAVLGSIQEAVLIFDSERTIQFANESAQRLFQSGRMLKGARLESVLRSSSLLEFLGDSEHRGGAQLRQISLDWKGEEFWFEASCAVVRGGENNSDSTILVLHDITRLKSLEMIRREFVANVSHELRTPLTIIKGFAETLVEDNESLPVEARARFLGKILNNAERLHVLVEDLLTLSRLESKPDQIEQDQHSLKQLFEDTIDNYRSRLDAETQQFVLEFDTQIGEFSFDRFRINQVVDNLVENAFRYAQDFTVLTVTARYDQASNLVECCVRDDGPGIPEKDVPHIFERFYRVDKGRSRERGGTGLGLSISKHIIQLHGGTVRAESKSGEGAAFYFTLPYGEAPLLGAAVS